MCGPVIPKVACRPTSIWGARCRHGEVRPDLESLPEAGGRIFGAAHPAEDDSEVAVRLGEPGLEFDGAAEGRLRGLVRAAMEESKASRVATSVSPVRYAASHVKVGSPS